MRLISNIFKVLYIPAVIILSVITAEYFFGVLDSPEQMRKRSLLDPLHSFEFHEKKGKKRYVPIMENDVGSSSIVYPNVLSSENPFFPKRGNGYKLRIDENGYIKPSKIHGSPDYKIIFMGGSTTENRYVKESARFPYYVGRLLEKNLGLKVNVYNDSRSARNSSESLVKLITVNVHQKPDAIIWHHNINDLNTMQYVGVPRKYYRNINLKIKTEHELVVSDIFNAYFPFLSSRISSLIKSLKSDDKIKVPQKMRDYNFPGFPGMHDIFKRNLQAFINICNAWGIKPILMTQANTYIDAPDSYVIKELRNVIDYKVFAEKYAIFNQSIREIGMSNNVMVIDLDRIISKKTSNIYDGVHFTEKGSILAGNIIAEQLGQGIKSEVDK